MNLYNTQNSTQISEAVQDACKDPMLCPHPFCVSTVYVGVYILGACYHIKVQEQWTESGYPPHGQVWLENLIPTFPLFLFLSLSIFSFCISLFLKASYLAV